LELPRETDTLDRHREIDPDHEPRDTAARETRFRFRFRLRVWLGFRLGIVVRAVCGDRRPGADERARHEVAARAARVVARAATEGRISESGEITSGGSPGEHTGGGAGGGLV